MVETVYKSRKPKASPLYQSISDHFSELALVYKERYQGFARCCPRGSLQVPRLRGSKKRLCPHQVHGLQARSPFGFFLQGTLLLPLMSSEKRVDVWGMDHGLAIELLIAGSQGLMEPVFSYSGRAPKSKFLSPISPARSEHPIIMSRFAPPGGTMG